MPRDLLESELFGHEAGSFTGVEGCLRGYLEQADGGTLFLDEIGEMDLDLQTKLLTAMEDRVLRRLGGEKPVTVDVQVIAASNRDLERQVREGSFPSDLYHRLSVFRLDLPALRERTEVQASDQGAGSECVVRRPMMVSKPVRRNAAGVCAKEAQK